MFKELNPLLHSELRLAVMSILLGVEEADFVFIREQTGASAGNLSVQIDKLQKAGYITVEKTFRGKMPRTLCRITPTGVDAFEEYVEALKSYIKKLEGKQILGSGGDNDRFGMGHKGRYAPYFQPRPRIRPNRQPAISRRASLLQRPERRTA